MRIPFFGNSGQGAAAAAPPPPAPMPAAIVLRPGSADNGRASLAHIIGRRTPILWFEAVAIVEGLTAALSVVADDPKNVVVPDLADVFIAADGTVQVGSTRGSHRGVQSLARTLHVLLAGEQVPPPLRLFIAKWIETPEAHTIQEFVQALRYFVRPDGASLVRAVYERFLAMPELPPGAIVPKPEIERPKAPQPHRRGVPRWLLAGAAAVCVVAVAAAAWSLSNSTEVGKGRVGRLVADGRRLLDTAREELAHRFGIGVNSVPQTGVPTKLPPPAWTTPPRSRNPRPTTRAMVAELQPTSIPAVRGSFDPDHAPFLIPPSEPVTAGPAADLPEGAPESTLAALSDVVYTDTDAGVEPPQLVYPHLPRVSYGGRGVNSMEVVVGEDGNVERVRLVSAARRMTDMMLLSGAKSWKFAPALRDGQPVRYRITINWSSTQ